LGDAGAGFEVLATLFGLDSGGDVVDSADGAGDGAVLVGERSQADLEPPLAPVRVVDSRTAAGRRAGRIEIGMPVSDSGVFAPSAAEQFADGMSHDVGQPGVDVPRLPLWIAEDDTHRGAFGHQPESFLALAQLLGLRLQL